MKEYLRFVRALMTQFDGCHIEHNTREENMKADALSKYASSEIEIYHGTVYYKVLRTPTINIKLVAPISQGSCWMNPIRAHLETWWLLMDRMEGINVFAKTLRYVLIHEVLYNYIQLIKT